MKIKLQNKYYSEMGHVDAGAIVDPIIGKDWGEKINYHAPKEYHYGGHYRYPVIFWINEIESAYLLIKHPDVFEIYYENKTIE